MNPHKALSILELAIEQSGSGEHDTRPPQTAICLAYDVLLDWLDLQRSRYHCQILHGVATVDEVPDGVYYWLRVIGQDAKRGGCCRLPGVDRCVMSLSKFIAGRLDP